MTDIAHFNMVEQQIRPWDVHAMDVLEAISRLDRSLFVPEEHRDRCFFDMQIPLDAASYMLAPKVAARMLQALEIKPEDHLLVVGAGSGYTTALGAMLASTVVCLDEEQGALGRAEKNCAAAGLENIGFQNLGSSKRAGDKVEYDTILLRESRVDTPREYIKRLSEDGRCVALVGDERILELMRYTRRGKEIEEESLIDILTPENDPLVETAEQRSGFVF